MLRKDREITDFEEITEVLGRCDTLSLGLRGGDFPYVVPVSFGVVHAAEGVRVYFHGAARGKKAELLAKDPRVCVEGHIFRRVEPTEQGITTRYESVIGFGTAEKAEGSEIIAGLRSITAHYGYPDYPADRCKGLSQTAVYRIDIKTLTGKRNLGE